MTGNSSQFYGEVSLNKKLFSAGILFFLVFSMGFPAFKKIEHLVWADTGAGNVIALPIANPAARTVVDTPSFLSFHVPASPGSEALFFDVWGQLIFKWSSSRIHRAVISIQLKVISSVIPTNVNVSTGSRLVASDNTNKAQDSSGSDNRFSRTIKWILRGDKTDYWYVTYKSGGEPLPQAQALSILKNLIKKGFDVQINATGELQGVQQASLYPVTLQVTRLAL